MLGKEETFIKQGQVYQQIMPETTHLASSSNGVPAHMARGATLTFFCHRISAAETPPPRHPMSTTASRANDAHETPDRDPPSAAMWEMCFDPRPSGGGGE